MAIWAQQQQLDEKIRDKTRNVTATPKDKTQKRKDSRQTVVQFQMPSVKTWRKIIKLGIESGFDPRAFVPAKRVSGNKAQSRLVMEALVIMQQEVAKYATDRRVKKSKVIGNVGDAIEARNEERAKEGLEALTTPSARTIYRQIKNLDAYTVMVNREGLGVANSKFALNFSGMQVRCPMEVLQIDEWKLDVLALAITSGRIKDLTKAQIKALKKVRLWAVVVIDCATRCIVGFAITRNPGVEAALRAVEMTTMDKTEIAAFHGAQGKWNQSGLGRSIESDNGEWFISNAFQQPVTDIGMGLKNTVASVACLRGHVERVFGTWSNSVMEELPGRTFRNVVEKGDYKPSENACLTEDEITSIMVRFIVDVYHNLPHEGLGGETPARAWDRLTSIYGVDLPPDGYARRAAFGLPGQRRIGNHGINLFGIEYTSPLVQSIFLSKGKTNVDVRVDPKDLGWVAMHWEGKWHPVRAKLDFLDKVHLTDWIATETAMRDRYRGEAKLDRSMVRAALADIRQTVAAASARLDLGTGALSDAEIARARDRLYIGMPIVGQDGDVVSGPVVAAVDLLADDRTNALLASESAHPTVTAILRPDDDADFEGGEEPEIH